eukprot:TRINITY_DN50700_c0_g1_i1.p1 TRINITY_DN50700_c0_g1~~TRINITY_DN50700_c0_g1_i1.p1  ORF type:complete len:382 (+),score=70.72 TRINITY_DN50700_c0_g1_i1:79-1224(+)
MAELKAGVGGMFYPPHPVLSIAQDGQGLFVSCGGGGAKAKKEVPNVVQVHRFDAANSKLSTIASLNTDDKLVHALSYASATGHWLASTRGSCKILSFSEAENSLVELSEFLSDEEGKEPIQNFAKCSPKGDLIVTGGSDACVKLWSMGKDASQAPSLHHKFEKGKEVKDADFNAAGTLMVASDESGECRVWKTDSLEQVCVLKFQGKSKGPVYLTWVRFLENFNGSPAIVSGAKNYGGPSRICIYSLDGTMQKVTAVDNPVTAFAVSADAEYVAMGLINKKTDAPFMKVFSVKTLKVVKSTQPLHTQSLPVSCVEFLDSRTIITGSGDKSFHITVLGKSGGGGSCGACCYILFVLFVVAVVAFFILRIGIKGAALGAEGEL